MPDSVSAERQVYMLLDHEARLKKLEEPNIGVLQTQLSYVISEQQEIRNDFKGLRNVMLGAAASIVVAAVGFAITALAVFGA
jgi:hypothetical protein